MQIVVRQTALQSPGRSEWCTPFGTTTAISVTVLKPRLSSPGEVCLRLLASFGTGNASLRPASSLVNHPQSSDCTGVQGTNPKSEEIDRTDSSIAALPSVVTRRCWPEAGRKSGRGALAVGAVERQPTVWSRSRERREAGERTMMARWSGHDRTNWTRGIEPRRRASIGRYTYAVTVPDAWQTFLADPAEHWKTGYSPRSLAHS